MSSDAKTSTPRNPVGKDRFKYLPAAAGTKTDEDARIASIYFSTDEPRKTLRNKNESVKHQCTHPGEYLETHAKMALEDLFLPIDGGWDGDPTESDDQPPEGYVGTNLVEACKQLANMRWQFKAYADPRESSQYNIDLSKDRARVAACYAMKYIWDNGTGDDPSASPHENAMKGLLDWWDSTTGSTRDQRQKQWTNTYWDSVAQWRATTWWNIWHNFTSRSVFYGDGGLDPGDLDQQLWDDHRKVDIYVRNITGSADRDWSTGCGGLSWMGAGSYVPDDKENWVPVVDPNQLVNFVPDNQFQEDWDPGADPDSVTPNSDGGMLLWLMQNVSTKEEEYERGEWVQSEFVRWMTKLIYGYQYARLTQHEFLSGQVPPGRSKGPGKRNPGTNLQAHDLLCESVVEDLGNRFDELIEQSERGKLIFGGNINDAGINNARQIAHQYHTRMNPWYRSAYLEEIPGSKDEDNDHWWPNLDGRDPSELYHWPELSKTSVSDLNSSIKEHLDPVTYGDLEEDDVPAGKNWATGIPKALADDADFPDPDGYMSGQKHYTWLAKHGGYGYDDLAYMDDDNPILTQSARDSLEAEYKKRNGDYGETLRSYTEKARYAVRRAMVVVKAQLSEEHWQQFLEDEREPYPDYTDDAVWQDWQNPLPSEIIR